VQDQDGQNNNIASVYKPSRLRWTCLVTRMEAGRSAFKILTDKSKGERPSGRPRHRWKDNVRIALKEIGINTRNWIDSAQYRRALNLLIP
jgi:hypothetical protein